MAPLFVLVHSPLVGPLTWMPVADHLHAQGQQVIVPNIVQGETQPAIYWEQHAQAVQQALRPVPEEQPLVLVGHSGAGPLLPAISMLAGHPISAHLFVDASLPHAGLSRLAEMEQTVPELGQELRVDLQAGGRYPTWSDADLRELIPDERLRSGLLAEMRPRGLDFFSELLPMVEEWPDAPCGYLQLSEAYAWQSQQARLRNWPCWEIDAGHFHMLVEPARVADLLIEMLHTLTGTL